MGRHYVPRLYLRGFADERERLWAFDRRTKKEFCSNIDNLAQETKFYPDELEATFSQEIETPVAPILTAVRARAGIRPQDKAPIARYFAAQLKRVPAGKKRYTATFPDVARNAASAVSERIDALVEETPDLADLGAKRKREVSALIGRYVDDPPDGIWYDTLTPEKLDLLCEAIRSMRWRFFCVDDSADQFLTSDNPVFYFDALGLGHDDAELSIPVSRDLVLCADRRRGGDLEFFPASPQLVKEINRRTVRATTRFVFAHANDSWVASFCYKEHPRLKSIR